MSSLATAWNKVRAGLALNAAEIQALTRIALEKADETETERKAVSSSAIVLSGRIEQPWNMFCCVNMDICLTDDFLGCRCRYRFCPTNSSSYSLCF